LRIWRAKSSVRVVIGRLAVWARFTIGDLTPYPAKARRGVAGSGIARGGDAGYGRPVLVMERMRTYSLSASALFGATAAGVPRAGGREDAGGGNGGGANTGVITKTERKTKKPSLYKVLLLNDDYTPMEFVIHVLEKFFNKGREDATRIMLHVHQNGVGVCGVFTYEVAETKVTQVMDFAGQHQHPLQCTMEKD